MHMDPSASVCRLHPGVAVTGFCPACLRDRLAGLHPPNPSAADLRRCKSFSYARSAAAVEPQRRSCDLFRHGQGQPIEAAVPEEEEEEPAGRSHSHQQVQPKKSSSSSLGGLLGKKLQQWRRKGKKEPVAIPVPLPEMMEMPARHRPSCDADPRRASWDARSGPGVPALGRLPASSMLSSLPVEEYEDYADDSMAQPAVPRSDGQIPVEEDYCGYYYDNNNNSINGGAVAVPGGSVQTRDYYLDSSSSSSRRRRSVDRSTTSGRNSFSDAANNNSEATCRMTMMMNNNNAGATANNGNARVSPAGIAAERLYHYHEAHHHHHHQSVLVHHHHQYGSREADEEEQLQGPNNHNLRAGDDFSGSFRSGFPFRDGVSNGGVPTTASKPNKKGIKGWSIWGLISKKSSSSKYSAEAAAGGAGGGEYGEYPWPPELRARGYNGQMLRCNSSISARSSFSGGGGTGNLSGRRSISGVDMRDADGGFRRTRRRDEVLLERNNLSTTTRSSSSYSRSGHHDLDPAMAPQYHHQQSSSSRPPSIPRRSSSNSKHEFGSLPPAKAKTRRSTLGQL